MSKATVKVIRTTLMNCSRRIGEGREDIDKALRGGKLLEEYFPDAHCETALDGVRFVPLREIEKIVNVCLEREKQARQSGFESGKAAGLQEGQAEAKKVFDSFSGAVTAAIDQRESILRDAESNALNVILKIARKVTCDSAKIDTEVTVAIIKGSIEQLADRREIHVKVNPEHHEELKSRIEEFRALSTEIRKLSIEPDARINYGGCFIHTPSGDIDARLESQLDVIAETLAVEET